MSSAPIFVLVDDKHIPVYRVMWVSDVPHFCGNDDCHGLGGEKHTTGGKNNQAGLRS